MKKGSDKLTIACHYLSKATSDLKRQNQFAQLQRHRRGNLALKATIFHRRKEPHSDSTVLLKTGVSTYDYPLRALIACDPESQNHFPQLRRYSWSRSKATNSKRRPSIRVPSRNHCSIEDQCLYLRPPLVCDHPSCAVPNRYLWLRRHSWNLSQ